MSVAHDSPSQGGYPTLRFADGPLAGKSLTLEASEMTLGRNSDNDIVVNDPGVSRRHCRFWIRGEQVFLTDLASTNGTTVNGTRIEQVELRDGDLIVIGSHLHLRFLRLSLEGKELQQKLLESASRDPLTGTLHGQAWKEQAETWLQRCTRRGRPVGVAVATLEFRSEWGQECRERLLLELCRKTKALGREALIGRTDTWEISLFLAGFTQERARQRMVKLVEDMQRHPVEVEPEGRVFSSLTVGLVWSARFAPLDLLHQAARACLQEARQQGGGKVLDREQEFHPDSLSPSTSLLMVKQKRSTIRTTLREPVRITTEAGELKAVLLDLSPGGMRIHLDRPLAAGIQVEVAPEQDPSRRVTLVVKWYRRDQCGLRFLLTPDEIRESWVGPLLERLTGLSDRRGQARLGWSPPFVLSGHNGFGCQGQLVNLGYGGLSAESSQPPPVGIHVRISFCQISLPGRVIWRQGNRFGLEFGLLDAQENSALLSLVKKAVSDN